MIMKKERKLKLKVNKELILIQMIVKHL